MHAQADHKAKGKVRRVGRVAAMNSSMDVGAVVGAGANIIPGGGTGA